MNFDDTQTSRSRLLYKAKQLFARHGYDNVSTATIAREAMTSESQLAKIFGGKAGLLEAVFDDGWRPVNDRAQRLAADAADAREAVQGILMELLKALEDDLEFGFLVLMEGRRIRGNEGGVLELQGSVVFVDLVQRLVKRGQKDGSFASHFSETAISGALIGATENLARDRILAQRAGKRNPFSEKESHRILESLLNSFSGK